MMARFMGEQALSSRRPDCPFTGKFCTRGCRSLCDRSAREAGLDPETLQRGSRGPLAAAAADGQEEVRAGAQKRS
jgi:hypothetical protein